MSKTNDLLKQAKELIQGQQDQLDKNAKLMREHSQFKLAFEITAKMAQQDRIEAAEFQTTMQQMLDDDYSKLQKRAEFLEIADPAGNLDLGEDESKGQAKAARVGGLTDDHGPAPHSPESAEAMQQAIASISQYN